MVERSGRELSSGPTKAAGIKRRHLMALAGGVAGTALTGWQGGLPRSSAQAAALARDEVMNVGEAAAFPDDWVDRMPTTVYRQPARTSVGADSLLKEYRLIG